MAKQPPPDPAAETISRSRGDHVRRPERHRPQTANRGRRGAGL